MQHNYILVRHHAPIYVPAYYIFRKQNLFSEHQTGYDAFCESVIKQRLEINHEILRLTKLQELLIRHIKIEEGIELEKIRYVCIFYNVIYKYFNEKAYMN
jgi:hypothetical protein